MQQRQAAVESIKAPSWIRFVGILGAILIAALVFYPAVRERNQTYAVRDIVRFVKAHPQQFLGRSNSATETQLPHVKTRNGQLFLPWDGSLEIRAAYVGTSTEGQERTTYLNLQFTQVPSGVCLRAASEAAIEGANTISINGKEVFPGEVFDSEVAAGACSEQSNLLLVRLVSRAGNP